VLVWPRLHPSQALSGEEIVPQIFCPRLRLFHPCLQPSRTFRHPHL